jgi:peptidoglycan/LPS O-acetylase OafA/YrhL
VQRAGGYRPDIDGLRALAVLPVLFYHSGVPGFSGGYVGVDVFFVISGFLITGIIAREIDEGRFSLLQFYERRARRIMPALLAMVAAAVAGAAFLYLPADFEFVPRSALAALAFVSNLLFFTETGYFQGGAETKPLLHTWSLAIEEQFYIGFPLLLMLVARWAPSRRMAVVAGIAASSFALAVATQSHGSGFAFYLLPARAWELAVGALLALGVVPALTHRAAREIVALCGLAAILGAAMAYDSKTVFPGLAALPPVLGAAALIHCAPGTAVGRLLRMRALTAIGLISYSLYLWHWPIAVFARYALDGGPSGWATVAVIALSFAAAVLSWRYIEQPFRRPGGLAPAAVLRRTAAAMAVVGLVSAGLMSTGGWPSRFPPEVVRLAGASSDFSPMRAACHDNASAGRAPCTLGAEAEPDALLWGDSHGVELAYVLSTAARLEGRSLVQRTQSSCPPILGYDPPNNPQCAAANRDVFASIQRNPRIRTVYLSAFWASEAYASPAVLAQLDRTVAALLADRRKVVILGAVPPVPFDVPRRLASLAAKGELDRARGPNRAQVEQRVLAFRQATERWSRKGVAVIDPIAAMCGPEACEIVRNGRPLYFDSHHLSLAGARLVLDPPSPAPNTKALAAADGERQTAGRRPTL